MYCHLPTSSHKSIQVLYLWNLPCKNRNEEGPFFTFINPTFSIPEDSDVLYRSTNHYRELKMVTNFSAIILLINAIYITAIWTLSWLTLVEMTATWGLRALVANRVFFLHLGAPGPRLRSHQTGSSWSLDKKWLANSTKHSYTGTCEKRGFLISQALKSRGELRRETSWTRRPCWSYVSIFVVFQTSLVEDIVKREQKTANPLCPSLISTPKPETQWTYVVKFSFRL